MPRSDVVRPPENPVALWALGAWAGIVTGLGEVAISVVRGISSDFTFRSRDALWMIPAFDLGLFALAGLVLAVARFFVRVSLPVAAGLFAGLGAALLLLLVNGLHAAAALVLAAGIGVQMGRLVEQRTAAACKLVRQSLPWLLATIGLTAVLTVGSRALSGRLLAHARPRAGSGCPNVLLLILDTVRAANLSLYGYPRPTTRWLERLAEHSTVFDRAYAAAPWTLPSHASIFTGRPAFELGVDWRTRLGKRWPTLAEVLYQRGYATAAFVANTEYVSWESGLNRGFEHYDDYPVTLGTAMNASAFGSSVYPWFRAQLKSILLRAPPGWRRRIPELARHRSADEVAASFLEWLDRTHPAPFFAFLNFMDAHDFRAPASPRFHTATARPVSRWAWSDAPPVRLSPTDAMPMQDAYDGAIAYLDRQIRGLMSELERRQLLENTVVIVTADHGEEFAEHGLVSHGYSLYRFSLQVPLVIWYPRRVPEGLRVSAPVSLQQLSATILGLVDQTRPSPLPGRSLARFWNGGDTTPETIVTSTGFAWNLPKWYPVSRGALRSIAFAGWRYIRNEGDQSEELYDFDADLLERWNLVGTMKGDSLLPSYRAAADALVTDSSGAAHQ